MNVNDALTGNGENALSLSTDNAAQDITRNPFFRFERDAFIGESVNNYFKSMKEIEAEFLSSMSAAKNTLKNMLNDLSQFGQNLIYMDGDINFPDPDDIHHGYMEENY
jgi:hypothetical protein